MNILLTGFEPFGGETINPAQQIIEAISHKHEAVSTALIPCEFASLRSNLQRAVALTSPDAILCLGQAGSRPAISIERVAINLIAAPIPDNLGYQPAEQAVVEAAPAAYFSNLPVKAMTKAILDLGIPATLSYTAGTYLCNQLMFEALHLAAKRDLQAGFIHLPYLPEQVLNKPKFPSMALNLQIQAVQAAIQAIVDKPVDIEAIHGSTH
ncbi:MAG: pyroglutamyl-peptidase I [Eubacteriales bacterium]|nr:pyroglutamyl-peptidase I [Eubacteriales bacterium]